MHDRSTGRDSVKTLRDSSLPQGSAHPFPPLPTDFGRQQPPARRGSAGRGAPRGLCGSRSATARSAAPAVPEMLQPRAGAALSGARNASLRRRQSRGDRVAAAAAAAWLWERAAPRAPRSHHRPGWGAAAARDAAPGLPPPAAGRPRSGRGGGGGRGQNGGACSRGPAPAAGGAAAAPLPRTPRGGAAPPGR